VRKKKRCQHTRYLAEHFLEIALLETYAKHEPMRVNVLDSAALAEDVRTLEMIETLGMLPTLKSAPAQAKSPEHMRWKQVDP
jgi:hypothetical protein